MTTPSTGTSVVTKHLDWMVARRQSPNSITARRNRLAALADWAGGPILYLTEDDLRTWIREHVDSISAQTLATYLVHLRGFYRWAHIVERIIEVDPTAAIELPRRPRGVPDPISEAEFRAAVDNADATMRAILGLACFAGLRAAEIAGLTWSCVRWDDKLLRIVGKGGHVRHVPLAPRLAELLALIPARTASRTGPVIGRRDGQRGHNSAATVSHLANDHLHDAGSTHTLHKLRHRFGTGVLDACGDLRVTQEALGHASPATTAVYARVSQQRMRDAVDQASGWAS